MKNALILAGAVAALAFTSTPAAAQAVSATTDATATARIFRPLTLTSTQDLDLGTIVLSGAAPFTDSVSVDQSGVRTCGANLTCSGTPTEAVYAATGTRDQTLTITVAPTLALVNQTQASPNLSLAVNAPASALLDATGNVSFGIGGSISVSDTTADGVYQGTFAVTAEYQ